MMLDRFEKMFAERTSTAFHEAGHCIAMLSYGRTFSHVYLHLEGGETSGCESRLDIKNPARENAHQIVENIRILMAGKIAEEIYSGKPAAWSKSDLENVRRLSDTFQIDDNFLNQLYQETRKLLISRWVDLSNLAEELDRVGWLQFNQIKTKYNNYGKISI